LIVRKIRKTAALLAIAAVVGSAALAGCSDSDSSEASTPAGATTAANSALQTDSEGATVTAPPAETSAATTEPAETEAPTEEPEGDVAAGKTTFEGVCQGCHPAGGTQAGVGPQLAGGGRDEALIRTTIQNGKGAMPGGLVSGDDEDNVVAYVVSIQ
jgi:cytochrome c551